MAKIRKISFDSVGTSEGCTCDKCGQWIKNIWTVTFDDGASMHYGIDCFSKMKNTGNLSDHGKKLLNKVMKNLKKIEESVEDIKNRKAEDDWGYQQEQENRQCAWCGVDYEEYRSWMLNAWIPARLQDIQKDIDKFKNVSFER